MSQTGKLVICPTPLGNLGDMPARALDALREADTVCAEDTRITGRLLAAFEISKRLERLDEQALSSQAERIVDRVACGEVIAYCSDAGMPGVSDPGLRLVRAAQEAGVPVEVLPGPTAVATAYVASGIESARFYFGGFFPRREAERTELLEQLKPLDAALLFYESPKRLASALAAIAQAYPEREAAVCRELTKLHEEVVRDRTGELAARFAERERAGALKGEIVIVVGGPSKRESALDAKRALDAARLRASELKAEGGHTKKDIAAAIQAEFGITRNDAYAIAIG
ncbi:16S rRNA (cytidine(1402)-2'-O)-methyltransferase [Raoultibacter massiliensis]|uniref:16S rRNA (cytidine(1402)-2'-O)-methyltransferase n=1 Tax=Raoultibacter massiliensis TaxID=1852371 RepID=UPI000C8184BA|nr:16S rRNA (cytidine(1402)-2'-O)-methyltransferase [Raoultibacter massiliensis]